MLRILLASATFSLGFANGFASQCAFNSHHNTLSCCPSQKTANYKEEHKLVVCYVDETSGNGGIDSQDVADYCLLNRPLGVLECCAKNEKVTRHALTNEITCGTAQN